MVLSSITRTLFFTMVKMGFQIGSVIKNPPANAGDTGSTPGQEDPPGGGNDKPLQYSCWGKGSWQATVCAVTKSWMLLNTHRNIGNF